MFYVFFLLPTIIPFILLYYKILKFIILWKRREERQREREKKRRRRNDDKLICDLKKNKIHSTIDRSNRLIWYDFYESRNLANIGYVCFRYINIHFLFCLIKYENHKKKFNNNILCLTTYITEKLKNNRKIKKWKS